MSDRHLSWQNLGDAIRRGRPIRIGIVGTPKVDIIVGQAGSFLGLLTPMDPSVELPPSSIELVKIEKTEIDGERFLLVSGNCRPLFEELYGLLIGIADAIQLDHLAPLEAVSSKIHAWKNLLRSAAILTKEQEIGLWGELWMLSRLLRAKGLEALRSWTGPAGEAHDFRLANIEFEVKTTRNRSRKHVISSLDQLVPSSNCALYILSIQIEPAGAGASLNTMIENVRDFLTNSADGLKQFNLILEQHCGYRDADATKYGDSFQFQTEPALIPVDSRCPKLTRSDLRHALPDFEQRFVEIRYEVNFEGLGILDGDEEFLRILPRG